jgi:hypothetical protein
VTFIGFSARDPRNTQEKVAAFVEKRGPKLGYTFAYADDRQTNETWMTAAGQHGIPCSFVVGKDGKIAFIGHPMYLDEVLPKVVAGTWSKEDLDAQKKTEEEVNGVARALRGDPETLQKALTDFEKNHPKLAHIPYFMVPRIDMLLTLKKTEEACKAAEAAIAFAVKAEDASVLRSISNVLQYPGTDPGKAQLAVAVKAAEAGVKVAGDKDAMALITLANAHFAAGNTARAKEYGAKALAASDKPPAEIRQYIETRIKEYDEEKKNR